MSFDGLFAYNAGDILPSTLKWYIASVLEIVSLWHKLFISPPPPSNIVTLFQMTVYNAHSFLKHRIFGTRFIFCLSARWDHELTMSESYFFLITDAIFFYDGSSQSNSDSGSSTSTFLGATLDLCSVLGQNGFSSGTARLLPLCNSNRMINQFLSASLWIWMILVSIFFPPSIYLPYSFCPF